MANLAYIYTLIDPRNQIPKYIGKSCDPNVRLLGHLSEKTMTRKGNWITSLKKKGLKPILEIVDQVDEVEWQFWERHYISLYKSWGFELLNHDEGGLGAGRLSIETRRKISENSAQKEVVLQYTLDGLFVKKWESINKASAFVNRSHAAISAVCRGIQNKAGNFIWRYHNQTIIPLTITTPKRKKGWHVDKIVVRKLAARRCKPILQFDSSGKFIREWKSAKAVSIAYKCNSGLITRCCKGDIKLLYNYIWKYKS